VTLAIPPAGERAFDAVALGEVMLRLDPGDGRIRTARRFDVWEGGGEYNVVRALSSVFGLSTSIVTALVANDLGDLLNSLIRAGGVDTSNILWRDFDGLGRASRNGLNFTERGFGVRGARGVSDRGHTAVSQLHPGELDLERLFEVEGTRWLHTGGIFAGLSAGAIDTAETVMARARTAGTLVSVDFNHRPSLWPDACAARSVFRRLAAQSDVVIGGVTDFVDRLGLSPADLVSQGTVADAAGASIARFEQLATLVLQHYPSVQVVATTTRTVHSASRNSWGALAFSRDEGVVASTDYPELEILDRVGGGDGFAAGLIDALLAGESLAVAVERGAAHGALAMTTPGDASMATRAEVLALAAGHSVGTPR
jgi:2-dehydro-3-deoxygluconokinase